MILRQFRGYFGDLGVGDANLAGPKSGYSGILQQTLVLSKWSRSYITKSGSVDKAP